MESKLLITSYIKNELGLEVEILLQHFFIVSNILHLWNIFINKILLYYYFQMMVLQKILTVRIPLLDDMFTFRWSAFKALWHSVRSWSSQLKVITRYTLKLTFYYNSRCFCSSFKGNVIIVVWLNIFLYKVFFFFFIKATFEKELLNLRKRNNISINQA